MGLERLHRPALVPTADGPVLAFYSTDGRLRRESESTPELGRRYYTHAGTPEGVVDNDLQAAALTSPLPAAEPHLIAPDPAREARTPVHPDEAADVARMRDHRVKSGGKTYQLLRGEFHRHTEISMDGGSDGSLEDMWRYALDAARLDWIGDGDHDNGGGKEYTWWLTQKTTDLYHQAPAFIPMHTYFYCNRLIAATVRGSSQREVRPLGSRCICGRTARSTPPGVLRPVARTTGE